MNENSLPEISNTNQSERKKFAPIDASEWILKKPCEANPILMDVFDSGDKVAIVGQSKSRKSFFALYLSICLSSGRSFLGFPATRKKKILLVQFEIKESHYHRRFFRMAESLQIEAGELKGYLLVCNARGAATTIEYIEQIADIHSPEIIVLDPFYKLVEGDENSSSDMKKILSSFDRLAEKTKAAILYVHHDKKGFGGDRQLTDRGAGSGVLSRDFDSAIILSPHKDEDDVLVVDFLTRNYPPTSPRTIKWWNYKFIDSDVLPEKRTSKSALKGRCIPISEWVKRGKDILLKDGPIGISIFKLKLGDLGASRTEQGRATEELITSGDAIIENKKAVKGLCSKVIRLADTQLALSAFADA